MNSENIIYNSIAMDYHLKRKKPWRAFESFVQYLQKKKYNFFGTSLDLGCANGRNIEILSDFSSRIIGIDNSYELLSIAKDEAVQSSLSPEFILSDICHLPLRDKSINNIFSIASIHHIKTKVSRKKAISDIYRILKSKGFFFLTLWRKFQKKYRFYFIKEWFKRFFNSKYKKDQKVKGLPDYGDKFVPWTISSTDSSYLRFYHFFSCRETKMLLKKFKIKEFDKYGGPNKKDNLFILAQKVFDQ